MQQARISMDAGKEQKEATKVEAKIEPAEYVREALRGMGRVQVVTEQAPAQQAYSQTGASTCISEVLPARMTGVTLEGAHATLVSGQAKTKWPHSGRRSS